jgi:drug/metabolite transporter (DMT)-like permease
VDGLAVDDGLKAVPAAQGGIFTVLLPISAALVGVLVLGESFSGMQLLAFGIALASVLLATLPTRAALRVGQKAKILRPAVTRH